METDKLNRRLQIDYTGCPWGAKDPDNAVVDQYERFITSDLNLIRPYIALTLEHYIRLLTDDELDAADALFIIDKDWHEWCRERPYFWLTATVTDQMGLSYMEQKGVQN